MDIWSLGVVFFVMLTGTLLLPNDDKKKKKLLERSDFSEQRLTRCKMLQKREASTAGSDRPRTRGGSGQGSTQSHVLMATSGYVHNLVTLPICICSSSICEHRSARRTSQSRGLTVMLSLVQKGALGEAEHPRNCMEWLVRTLFGREDAAPSLSMEEAQREDSVRLVRP